jgi:hypothetical protein
MEKDETQFDIITKQELYDLTLMLFNASKIMKKVDETVSEQLFKMASITMDALDQKAISKEVYDEIKSIEQEILCSQDT